MTFGIALGSNLGDRLHHLQSALVHLLRNVPGARLVDAAPLYETSPVDCAPGTQSFFNTVIEIRAEVGPLKLLHEMRRIEADLGRPNAHEHHAPRTVDLDLLYADQVVMNEPELSLPHPRLHQRRFVLQPLADMRPGLVLPGWARSVAELLAALVSPEPPLLLVEHDWARRCEMTGATLLMHVHPLTKKLRARKAAGEKLAVLTAYDYPTARLLDEAGVDLILVGDSLGMVVLGLPDTTGVTMNDMLHHSAAVRRAVKRAPVIVDLPAQSYDVPDHALHNAKRLVAAGADAVKLEGGLSVILSVKAIVEAGIGYVGHIGMLPQSVKIEGGYKKKGRTDEGAEALLKDALALEKAGAAAIVLESVVPEVAARITSSVKIPTIGIGSGEDCDAQVLVTHDLIGMFPWFTPPFAAPEVNVAEQITRAAGAFVSKVKKPAKKSRATSRRRK